MSFSKVEIEVDQTLADEVIRRYHLRSTREAVNLALRSLISGSDSAADSADEDDPFDLAALDPEHSRHG
jgi:Arc/MetJ family transcription regulator